jgi:hypothetical protein
MDPNIYQATPTSGRGTIRKFNPNASSMKCLAARDFEDLLQVIVSFNFLDLVFNYLDIFIVRASSLQGLAAR